MLLEPIGKHQQKQQYNSLIVDEKCPKSDEPKPNDSCQVAIESSYCLELEKMRKEIEMLMKRLKTAINHLEGVHKVQHNKFVSKFKSFQIYRIWQCSFISLSYGYMPICYMYTYNGVESGSGSSVPLFFIHIQNFKKPHSQYLT